MMAEEERVEGENAGKRGRRDSGGIICHEKTKKGGLEGKKEVCLGYHSYG